MQKAIAKTPVEDVADQLHSYPEFYFLRHGLTDANLRGLTCGGGWDVDLSPAGFSQAFSVAQGPLKKCFAVKTICSSPMKRAKQTTHVVKAILQVPVVVVEDFREIMVGEWERRPYHELPDPMVVKLYDPPGGESLAAFDQRVFAALKQALTNPSPILIVAHGGVWVALTRTLKLSDKMIDNCVLQKVWHSKESGKWHSEEIT